MPKEFNKSKVTPEALESMKSTYSKVAYCLDEELGRMSNFQDLINSRVELSNYNSVEEKFEAYKFAWSTIGRSVSNAEDVYFELVNSFKSIPAQEEVIAHNDAIIDSLTEHPYNTNAMYEDANPLIPETLYINCSNCGKVFKSFEKYGKCDKCSLKAKKVQENKKLKPFTFNSFLYVLIGFGILYLLFSLGYTAFLYIVGIGLFALLYFLDAKK